MDFVTNWNSSVPFGQSNLCSQPEHYYKAVIDFYFYLILLWENDSYFWNYPFYKIDGPKNVQF